MRICAISDTHEKHGQLEELPGSDVLIHAGDITMGGNLNKLKSFADWYASQKAPTKILIAGNHDWCFQNDDRVAARRMVAARNITYLQDEAVTIRNVKFYGSPWQPEYKNWAFNIERGSKELSDKWAAIPEDTDVLITHGPPAGILDHVWRNENIGCGALRRRVEQLKQLKAHVFGHFHEGYGIETALGRPIFYNACMLNSYYAVQNDPLVFDI